jgi:DNA repair photolyase
MQTWYQKPAPEFATKTAKSLIHPMIVKGKDTGLTINPYQGCQHRCGYCYATYLWSPEFFDKIYAKSNAPEILENELKSWKHDTIDTVMVSSATDPYQPAEIKYNLTRKCIEVLQKYRVPYYVFTKSSIILRDLELHKKYKDSCFLVWSITTCNENIRRLVEPGTPPANSIFAVIKKFVDAGVCCGVNIDPILPFITDSEEEIELILESCSSAGVKYIFGAILRLRDDIWQRMTTILKSLDMKGGIDEYRKIYQFSEPIKTGFNIAANQVYSDTVMHNLEQKITKRGLFTNFPDHMKSRPIPGRFANNTNRAGSGQLTLLRYM